MIPYKIQNKICVPELSGIRFEGEIDEFFDRFIEKRMTSDFAQNEILREAENAFVEKLDDKDMPIGMWRGEFWGKLTISLCRVYTWKRSERVKEILAATVKTVLSLQEDDGYIGSYKNKKHIMHVDPDEGAKVIGWHCEWNWNLWCRKYTLWALLSAYEILGDSEILAACRRFADCLIKTVEEQGVHICETGTFFGAPSSSILKPMLLLYRLTEDSRYFDFAKGIIEALESDYEHTVCVKMIKKSLEGIPVHLWCYDIPKTDTRVLEISGKIYETLSAYDGILEYYRLTGEEKYLKAAENLVSLLLRYEYNSVFSVGFNDVFIFAGSVQDAVSEPCDVIHFMRLLSELYRLTGNIKYMHLFDLAFVNPYLASIRRDGEWGARAVRSAGETHVYAPGQSGTKYSHCCVNNLPRGFVNAAESAVMISGDKTYINLYLPADADIELPSGERLGIKISDGYMQSCRVRITVSASVKGEKSIFLRIPDWSKKTLVSFSGKSISPACDSLAEVTVKNGETVIDIAFDDTPVIVEPYFNRNFFGMSEYMQRRYRHAPDEYVCYTKENMATLRYGAVLLALAGEDGYSKEYLFSGKRGTVYGKGYSCTLTPASDESFRCSYDVKLCGERGEINLRMHDYASAGDSVSGNGFSIFI